MSMKKYGICAGILCLLAAAAFAQNTPDDLAKWKRLFDGGVITEAEYQAKRTQILKSSVRPAGSMTRGQAYVEADHLLTEGFDAYKDRIAELMLYLTDEQKWALYERHSKSAGGYIALNLFCGFGIGSFVQGDVGRGVAQLATHVGGLTFLIAGTAVAVPAIISDSPSAAVGISMMMGGFASIATGTIIGCVSPGRYSRIHNNALRDLLDLPQTMSVAVAPIINPVSEQYGLVAKIML